MSDSNGTSPSKKKKKTKKKIHALFAMLTGLIFTEYESDGITDFVFRMDFLKNKSQPGFPQLDWQFSFRLNLEAVTSLLQKKELEVLGYTGSQHQEAWYELFVCLLNNSKLLEKKKETTFKTILMLTLS